MPQSILSSRSLYLQVRDALAERIAKGAWRPGALIPNEGELAREFGVSPGTMRKALISSRGSAWSRGGRDAARS